jgi:hypothetical protein
MKAKIVVMVRSSFQLLLLAASVATPLFAQAANAPTLKALSVIEQGQWAFRSRIQPTENRSICVTDPAILLQLRHRSANCNRFVIANDPRNTTVQYSCAGAGNGRTTLRVETPRLVQIDSQGIADREPFAIQLEGRRIGDCAAMAGSLRR